MSNLMDMHKDDDCLIGLFLSGDESGFDMLVKKYQDYVANVAYSLLGQGHSRHTDDIAQDVFISVYKNLRSFKKESKFSTWLYRITVNVTYNYLKRASRYVSYDEAGINDVPATASDPGRSRAEQQLVRQAIESLPFKHRTVIVLKEIEGLPYKEIASILKCSIGTVESRLFRARCILKARLSHLIKKEGCV